MGEPLKTEINQAPRLYLLRVLASNRDWLAEQEPSPHWPTHVPLYGAGDHPFDDADMQLAVKEATALGHIESNRVGWPYGFMLRITDAGYDHIRAHDAIGEASQEALRVR